MGSMRLPVFLIVQKVFNDVVKDDKKMELLLSLCSELRTVPLVLIIPPSTPKTPKNKPKVLPVPSTATHATFSMADWEEANKRMTKTGEGEDDDKPVQSLDAGDIELLQVGFIFFEKRHPPFYF